MTTESAAVRALAILVLLAVLGGLFVVAGTDRPNPDAGDYPSADEVGPNPDAYVGDPVSLGGRVVATDPVVVAVPYGTGGTYRARVTGLDRPVSEGDYVTAFGTLSDPSTLAVDRVILREPWEMWYMYLVSFVGGAWVLARILRRWRFDADRLAVVPRDEPVSIREAVDA